MSKKKAAKVKREEFRVHGHDVVIVREGGQETLTVNGERYKFDKLDAGYVLRANVFAEPQKMLADAVKLYLQRYARGD